jgi:hypothetical protein
LTGVAATRVDPDAGDGAPAGGTGKQPRLTALLRHPGNHRRVRTVRQRRARNNAVIGVIGGFARSLEQLGRDLERALMPRKSPLLRALERARIEQEMAERNARADAAERAPRDREFQEWLEEQRRRLEEELQAIRNRARQRRHAASVAAFAQSFAALTKRVPKTDTPKKSGRKKRREERDGQLQKLAAKFLRRLDARADNWQRIKEFFAAAQPSETMLHTDPRYRDTLGTGIAAAVLPAKISGPSLHL